MGGNAIDAHSSNTLTDNNTVGTGTGKVGGARDFELDSAEYFTRADNADLSFSGDASFTFALWVKMESKPAEFAIILSKGIATDTEYVLYYRGATIDRFRFELDATAGFSIPDRVTANNFGSPSTGVWYFIVVWRDPSDDTISIQVNNGTADSVSNAGAFDGTGLFRLGDAELETGVYWDGLIDEVGIWKRVLTASERTELYNSGNGRSYSYINGGGGGGTGIRHRVAQ